jgi:transcriptional regulator with XRE-family HTH domain
MVRLVRGVSKQELARAAGTSRQQLWRVMTGKSELTAVLCQRLASVLDIDSRTLSSTSLAGVPQPAATVTFSDVHVEASALSPDSLAAYLAGPAALQRTLRTLPAGDDGIPIKCALLNAVEERARQQRHPIPAWLFRVRASVLGGAI